MPYAVLFPGQGSQFRGMGADLFAARPDLIGEPADRILGWSLQEMCLEAPEELLTRTEHAQPALFALSYTLWEEVNRMAVKQPVAGAGHSLGEYTALAAAGVLGFFELLAIVAERGKAMAAAADLEASAMAAIIGVEDSQIESVVSQRRDMGGRLYLANLNAPGQLVVAGGVGDIEWLASEATSLGLRRVIPLKVAGAFHSPFMDPAAARLEEVLTGAEFADPRFPVWGNVGAIPLLSGELAHNLIKQVVSPVRFAESLAGMNAAGVTAFLHIGPGDVTAGLARKSVPGASTFAVSDLGGIPAAVEWLGTID